MTTPAGAALARGDADGHFAAIWQNGNSNMVIDDQILRPAGDLEFLHARGPREIHGVRRHLFHVMLVRLSLAYLEHTTVKIRRLIEFVFLAVVSSSCMFLIFVQKSVNSLIISPIYIF